MSAALQLPLPWSGDSGSSAGQPQLPASAIHHIRKQLPPAAIPVEAAQPAETDPAAEPVVSFAFYRKHTESLLRRYLYASMQVGRSPNLLGESIGRGWVSSRRVRTFEDALIFVLDVERCLKKLSPVDLRMVTRICLQDYTHAETAVLMGMSTRTLYHKVALALDRLTKSLVESDLLVLTD